MTTNQIVQLDCGDASIDTRDDLLSDCDGVYMVHIKAITESGDTCCDLVELDTLLASVCRGISWPSWLSEA